MDAIARVEIPADDERNPERAEMPGRDAIAIDERCIAA